MKYTVTKAYRVQFFVPRGTDFTDVIDAAMELGNGGYTEHPNCAGVWTGPHPHYNVLEEPVRVIDVLCTGITKKLLEERVADAGVGFLHANPAEKVFMAYVGGSVLTMYQEEKQ